jgi:hypothetical protein
METIDNCWNAFQAEIKRLSLDAEVRASSWLADGNAAKERGNMDLAEKCYAKSQFWVDRYNRLTGRA